MLKLCCVIRINTNVQLEKEITTGRRTEVSTSCMYIGAAANGKMVSVSLAKAKLHSEEVQPVALSIFKLCLDEGVRW